MRLSHNYLISICLAGALATPFAVTAAPAGQDANVQVRVYDSGHKDYHTWDDRENKAWGVYLSENHKKTHEFSKASKKEQADYWNWRHAHPDTD